MKIAVIGLGFVGTAVARAFSSLHPTKIDPKLGTSIESITDDYDVCFVCTPTPSSDDGSVDLTITRNVINYLLQNTYSIVVVKSTVPPSFARAYSKQERVVFNPEFLRERSAIEDMILDTRIVLGGTEHICARIKDLYEKHSCCMATDYFIVSGEEASWIKHISNSMLSIKLAYLTELHDNFNDPQSWVRVIRVLSKDSRLGTSHWLVPGPDGKLGFGGACFPKDANALLHDAKNLSILNSAIESNNKVRSKYSLDARETEQHIKFKKEN